MPQPPPPPSRRHPCLPPLLLLLLIFVALLNCCNAFIPLPLPLLIKTHHHHHQHHHSHSSSFPPLTSTGNTLWEAPDNSDSDDDLPPPVAQNNNLSAALPDLLGSRSLGLDWGHKKIGLALSAGFSERPLGTIRNPGGITANATRHRPTIDHILGMVRGEGAVRIVVGHPLYRDGSLSPQANSTKEFARLIADRAVELGIIPPTGVPFVYLWDERLTSQAAKINIKTKSFLHSSDDIDSQAACLVLEDFYVHKAHKAEVVWPSEGVMPLVRKRAAAAAGAAEAAGSEGRGGGEDEEEDGTSSGMSAATTTTTRTGMSYSDYRKAELERYGRSSSAPAPTGSDEEGAAKKKKKKKKKKK